VRFVPAAALWLRLTKALEPKKEFRMYEAFSLDKIVSKVGSVLPRKVVFTKKEPELVMHHMTSLNMNSPTRYKTVRVEESRNSKLIGILFAHPNTPLAKSEIVDHLNQFHYRSGEAVDFFCVGYGAYWPENYQSDIRKATSIDGTDWLFSDAAFSQVIDEIESLTKWQYSGETELILLSATKDGSGEAKLDFGSAIVCNLEAMSKDLAFTSVRAFFEGVFRFAKSNSCSNPAWGLSDAAGLSIAGSSLKQAVLSLLPNNLRDSYKKAEHYAIRNIE
tara:strand:- start:3601 stop:4428 length:828 start_codon:yes stop_codon:yes gene_type:complete